MRIPLALRLISVVGILLIAVGTFIGIRELILLEFPTAICGLLTAGIGVIVLVYASRKIKDGSIK